jgi:hypothetical protein
MITRSVFLSAIITLAAACSGSGPIPLEEFCARYAETLCDAAERCGCLSDLEVTYCPTYLAGECQDNVVAPVQSGTRAYDEAAAGHCLGGYRSMLSDCSVEGDSMPEACDTMLVGVIPAGQGCESDSDCQPGLECHSSACTAMPGQGDPCLDSSYCAEDLFCADDGRCEAPRGRGEACPEGGEACADDLYCDSATTTCQPPLGAGASCAADSWACGDGLYCAEATSTCTRYPGSGGDCAASSGQCAEGLYCDATDRCQAQKNAGEACTDDAECKSDDCTNSVCAGAGTCGFM